MDAVPPIFSVREILDVIDVRGTKTCKECHLKKSVRDFSKTPSGAPRGKCKSCIAAYKRQRYADDPERYKAEVKEWSRRNPRLVKQYEKTSRERRVAQNRERVRRWREKNPDKWKAQQTRAIAAERRRGYPNAHKRRALQHQAFVEHVDKRIVYKLCEGACGICGEPVEYKRATLDHIIPLSRGGLHCYDNIQVAHGFCNRSKGNKLPDEFELAA